MSFPINSILVNTNKICQLKHNKPKNGVIVYYNFILKSDIYPYANQNLWGYINTYYENTSIGYIKKEKEKWITRNSINKIWKPFERTTWINNNNNNNNNNNISKKEFSSDILQNIYKHSISNSHENILYLNT